MSDTKKDVVMRVENVKKDFFLPHQKTKSLKSSITQIFKPKHKGGELYHALRDISFEVERGDFFGVLGRNGAGKSTLLKIMAEIYRPTTGNVEVKGKLVPFIELGVGFNNELSGRENVYLNGALLGFSKKEVDERYDSIVEFAELENFMEQKLKNYSSGMKVRLAFSVAIQADADILLLDEVLAVGDAEFQKKCYNYFNDLKESKKTIIFVTHSMGAVRDYCNKAILIEDGKITHQGKAEDVADEYLRLFVKKNDKQKRVKNRFGDGGASIGDVNVIKNEKQVKVGVEVKSDNVTSSGIVVGIDIFDQRRRLSGGAESHNIEGGKMISISPGDATHVTFMFDNIFGSGEYSVNVSLKEEKNAKIYDFWRSATTFSNVNRRDYDNYFPVVLPARVDIVKNSHD